jgi:hypothetical protein
MGGRKAIRTFGDGVAMRRSDTVGWAEAEREVEDREPGQLQSPFYVDLGTTAGSIHVQRAPTIISGDIHPAFRLNDTASPPGDEFCSAAGHIPLGMIAPEPEDDQF